MLQVRQQASAYLLQDAAWQLAGSQQSNCVALLHACNLQLPTLQAATPPQPAAEAQLQGTDLLLQTSPKGYAFFPAGSHGSSAAAVAQLHASAHLLQGAAWQLAGSRQLAEVSALQVLANFEGTASTADQCLAYAQLAQIAVSKKGYR